MSVWQQILAELRTASKFERDWYAWACNQMAHVGLGMFGVWIMCLIAFVLLGEFPYRFTVFLLFTAAYLFFELRAQRWAGWDTIEDVLFVCIYGAGGTLASFTEFEVQSTYVILDVLSPVPFLAATIIHLAVGITIRIKRGQDG